MLNKPESSSPALSALALACCALAYGASAQAESPKGGGDAAVVQTLRKAQGMLRQLSQEKAELEAKVAGLEGQVQEMDALRARIKQLEPLEGVVKQSQASLEQLRASNTSLLERISGDADRLRSVGETYRRTSGELQKYQQDNALLVNAVIERTRWIEACSGKNKALLQANREWIDRHGDQQLWDEIIAAEPFTGIGAVAEENAAEEFRYQLGDLEVTPWRESEAPPAESPAAPPGPEDEEPEPAAAGEPR
jgi:hypothetical protein